MHWDIEGYFIPGDRVDGKIPTDPDFPYTVVVVMHSVILTHEDDEFIIFGKSREVLEQLIIFYQYRTSPQLVSLLLTGPNGDVLERLPTPAT